MLAASPVFASKKSSSLTKSSDLSFNPHQLSKSNIEPKSLQCPTEDMEKQMALLKQKAHQSFMQVIQMQQLHQQQIDQLRYEYQLKEESYQTQIKALEVRVRQLQSQNLILQKNYRQHSYNIDQKDLSIDNIELISCKEDDRLDESSICYFNQIIGSQSYYDQINSIHLELKKDLSTFITENQPQRAKVESLIDKLVEYIIHLKKEFVLLQELYCQAQKQLEQHQKKNSNSRINYANLEKETKFLGEQVNRLAGEKIKGEKKILQLERRIKETESSHTKNQEFSTKKSPKFNQQLKKKESSEPEDISLDMNDFIQQKLAKTVKQDYFTKIPMLRKKIKG